MKSRQKKKCIEKEKPHDEKNKNKSVRKPIEEIMEQNDKSIKGLKKNMNQFLRRVQYEGSG